MEIQFSNSMVMAIDALLRLHEGKFEEAPVTPVWCNFTFPSSLKASPIEEMAPSERGCDLVRTVEFFYSKKRIATVFLEGMKNDGMDPLDNGSFWAVKRIRYLPDAEKNTTENESLVVHAEESLVLATR